MNCLFCDIINKTKEAKILYEDELVIAILDAYPESEGHTLIIPKTHYTDIYEVPDNILSHMFTIAKKISDNNRKKLNVLGSIFCINYGDQQIIKHLHLHVFSEYKQKNQRSIENIYELIK